MTRLRLDVGGHEVEVDGGPVVRSLLLDLVATGGGPAATRVDGDDPGEVVRQLNHLAADPPEGRVAIHGGAIVLGGRTVLLAGPSYAGKSTFVAVACAGFGATYGGDEIVHLLVSSGDVAPYAKPVSLKPGSWRRVGRLVEESAGWRDEGTWLLPGSTLGGGVLRAPRPPDLVVFPERCNCLATEVTPVPPSEAALRLSRHAPNLHPAGIDGFRAVCDVARRADAVVVSFGDAARGVASLLEAIDGGLGSRGRS